jgi:hypothetical protein
MRAPARRDHLDVVASSSSRFRLRPPPSRARGHPLPPSSNGSMRRSRIHAQPASARSISRHQQQEQQQRRAHPPSPPPRPRRCAAPPARLWLRLHPRLARPCRPSTLARVRSGHRVLRAQLLPPRRPRGRPRRNRRPPPLHPRARGDRLRGERKRRQRRRRAQTSPRGARPHLPFQARDQLPSGWTYGRLRRVRALGRLLQAGVRRVEVHFVAVPARARAPEASAQAQAFVDLVGRGHGGAARHGSGAARDAARAGRLGAHAGDGAEGGEFFFGGGGGSVGVSFSALFVSVIRLLCFCFVFRFFPPPRESGKREKTRKKRSPGRRRPSFGGALGVFLWARHRVFMALSYLVLLIGIEMPAGLVLLHALRVFFHTLGG